MGTSVVRPKLSRLLTALREIHAETIELGQRQELLNRVSAHLAAVIDLYDALRGTV